MKTAIIGAVKYDIHYFINNKKLRNIAYNKLHSNHAESFVCDGNIGMTLVMESALIYPLYRLLPLSSIHGLYFSVPFNHTVSSRFKLCRI